MLPGPLLGSGRCSHIWGKCEVSIPEEARCGIKERDQKQQGDHAHVDDVEMVREVRDTAGGKGKRA